MNTTNQILYSINVEDVQQVARRELGRELTAAEIKVVEDNIGDQFDWFGAIANVLDQHIALHETAK